MSLVLSVALFFVWMIAVAFLYLVLGGMGVWSKLNSNVGDLLTTAGGSSGGELVSSGTTLGGAALIGLVNIVLLTATAPIGAFIYNLTTYLVGGVEVTLGRPGLARFGASVAIAVISSLGRVRLRACSSGG